MTACVGPGNSVMSLSEKLWNAGKFGFVVGTCSSIGISGFTLGGGYGVISRKYGLAIDRVKSFEIVTAESKVKKVSEKRNAELFWALRGAGSGNFGVVTEICVKLFDASNQYIWIIKEYKGNVLHELLEKWQNWVTSNPPISITAIFVKESFTAGEFTITFVIAEQNITEGEKQVNLILNTFPNITKSNINYGSYMDLLQATKYGNSSDSGQYYFRSKGFYVSKVLNGTEIELFVNAIRNHSYVTFVFDMYGGEIEKPRRNVTAFVHRTALYNAQFHFHVIKNESIENTRIVGKMYEQKLKQLIIELDFMNTGEHYQNYEDYDLQNWFEQYFKENEKRLMKIKRQVDPTNFFHRKQSIS
ncbi:FAD-binding dehydrogenase-like protein [Leptotrombidium deliense]|uniref:FAD-binding dehydrogenase-like protein n=1 Tax=Leptotrombidium deliense TaxID=299467 RepID=A0A443RX80_9ACAR|nr:FAD-binding dehydrogenase-like protein [Leptotrombidium deliense]